MIMDSTIYQILKNKPIVAYLERKGHQPVKMLSGGRLSYLCPFPDHNETKPSFMVWTNAEFENFHCFGCQRGYSIIHLVAGLENIPYRKAVELLSEGVEVSLSEDVKIELELLDKRLSKTDTKFETAQKLYAISTQCRCYLEGVGYDEGEVHLMDTFLKEVDHCLLELDFDAIDDCYNHLRDILRLRRDKFEVLRREKMRIQLDDSERN